MSLCRETVHISADNGNNGLCAGIANAGDLLDLLSRLLFFRLHEVVDIVVKLTDVGSEFIDMPEQNTHYLALKVRHDSVEVIYDLLLAGLQIVRNSLLLIEQVVSR